MNAEREAILNMFPDPLALGRDVCTVFDTTADGLAQLRNPGLGTGHGPATARVGLGTR